MARFTVLPNDPARRKAWSSKVAQDAIKDQYFSRMEGDENSDAVVISKKDLETAGAGDEVTTLLFAKLRGAPITEGMRMAGAEMRLQDTTHTMRINVWRHGVNIGARIEQARIGTNLAAVGRDKLKDYIKELYEEIIAAAANGARGTSTTEFNQLPVTYAGYPNALRAPDSAHYFVGTDNSKTFNTLTQTDVLSLKSINRLRTKSKKMLGGSGNAVRMSPTTRNGKDVFIMACLPEAIQDIREDVGVGGWLDAERALTTAIGKESELFTGGAGWFNGVLIDETQTGVKFNNGGAGGNLPVARSLYMGANAIAVAHGTKGLADGMTVALREDTDDRGYDSILNFELIFGADKIQYSGMDYAVITVDSAFTAAV